MKLIKLDSILIAQNRQRQEFEAQGMEDMRGSLELMGLLHAIVLRETPEGFYLVAGERRLKAIQDLWALGGTLLYDNQIVPEGEIPYVSLGELGPLEAEEAELDENLKRKDLTWQEHATAVKKLHDLRQAQAVGKANDYLLGMAARGFVPDDATTARLATHTVADTAIEVRGSAEGVHHDTIRQELIVARHLDNPDVMKAKNVKEAFKALKRSEASAANIALAAKVGATFTAEVHQAFNVNCLTWMATCPAESFDVILTDPPYGMGAEGFSDGGGKLTGITHQYDDSPEAWRTLMAAWAPLAYRVAKAQAHAYLFCDIARFHELKSIMVAAGWYVFRTPFIDYKIDSGRVPLPDRGPRRQWEMVLYAIKGNKPVTHIYPDVIPCSADANMTHGAQKPVSLYTNLLKRSIKPGDKVLDAFSGSGTIFEACHQMQCEATGLEQNPEYFGMGLRRLQILKETADPMSGLLDLVGEAPF